MDQGVSTRNELFTVSERGSAWRATDSKALLGVEEGMRLVKAFASIRSPQRRQSALEYVADLAKMDSAETLGRP